MITIAADELGPIMVLHTPESTITISFGAPGSGGVRHHDGAPAAPTPPPPDHPATDHPRPARPAEAPHESFAARKARFTDAMEAGTAAALGFAATTFPARSQPMTGYELRIAEAAAYAAIRAMLASQDAATQAPTTPEGDAATALHDPPPWW